MIILKNMIQRIITIIKEYIIIPINIFLMCFIIFIFLAFGCDTCKDSSFNEDITAQELEIMRQNIERDIDAQEFIQDLEKQRKQFGSEYEMD